MKLLNELGARIVELRRKHRLSRATLAERAGMSLRFLADVEAGRGNISIVRLNDVCQALEIPLAELVQDLPHANAQRNIIALIGLRGAGKTTIGKKVARNLKYPFLELDDLIEKEAGLALSNIFEVHGEEYYRKLEYETLSAFLKEQKKAVLATGGGIVTHEETYNLLRRSCRTVWLKADPKDHWERVLRQDPRPMANYPNAFSQLQNILLQREPLYALAENAVNTSALGIEQSSNLILEKVRTL